MTVTRFRNNTYVGLSSDTKPTNVATNSTFFETDTAANWIYNGTTWINIQKSGTVYGTSTRSGDSSTKTFTIAHGLPSTPSGVLVEANSTDAVGDFTWTFDATNITITYQIAPPSTTSSNLTWNWTASYNLAVSGFTTSSADTLTNKTIDASLNTIKNTSADVYYHIFKSGSNYLALNKSTGVIDSTNTDAATVIQAAINNAGANPSKGKIFIDTQGVAWSMSTSLTGATGVHLIGGGWQNSQLRAGGNFPVLINGGNFMVVQDLYFTHNTPAYSSALIQYTTGAAGNKILDCQFYDFGQNAGTAVQYLNSAAASANLGIAYNLISRCFSTGFVEFLKLTVSNTGNWINGNTMVDSTVDGAQHIVTSVGASGATVAQNTYMNVISESLPGNPNASYLFGFDDNNTDHSSTKIIGCTFFDIPAGVNVLNVNSNTSLEYIGNLPELYGKVGGSGLTSLKLHGFENTVKSPDSIGRRLGYWGGGYNGNTGVSGAVDSNGLLSAAINFIASSGSRSFNTTNGYFLALQVSAATTPKGFNVLPYFLSQFNPKIDLKMGLAQTAKTRTGFFITSATTNPTTGADPLNAKDGVGWYFDGTSVTDSTHWNSIHNGGSGATTIDPLDGTSGKPTVTADTSTHILTISTADSGTSWQLQIDGGTAYTVASPFARTNIALGLWVYEENPTDTTTITTNLYYLKTSQDK